jgi:dienelactone hydrolase
MNSKRFFWILVGWGMASSAIARVWTDTTGRKIEAEILSADAEKVLLKFKDKEVPLALARLSPADLEYVAQWKKDHAESPSPPLGELALCGTPLKPNGAVTLVEEPLSPAALKSFSKADKKPALLKLAVALPAGFDPAKPQQVMWVSAAINNEGERTRGNAGAMGAYAKTASEAGWVVIAADTDLGNPRMEDNQRSDGGDLAVHQNAVEVLTKAWPGFKSWSFACCGFSGGAKATFYRAGELLASDLKVIGMFLGGCNQDMTADAREETRCRSADLRKIKVFISNGKKDTISTVAHAETLLTSLKSGSYGDVRLELYEGAHGLNREEYEKALAWFKEPLKK